MITVSISHGRTCGKQSLKRNLEIWSDSDDQSVTLPEGSKVDINITRMELFWGLYLSACLYL